MNTTKRLYFYGVSFVTLIVAANGIALLILFLIELIAERAHHRLAARIRPAWASSMVIVGAPLWMLHWQLHSETSS